MITSIVIVVGWCAVSWFLNWLNDQVANAAHGAGYLKALMDLGQTWDTDDHWEQVQLLQDKYEREHPRNKYIQRLVDWILERRARRERRLKP